MSKKFNLKNYLVSVLRKASYRHPMRSEALRNARIGRNQYKCAECGNIFTNKEVQVDHKDSIVPTSGFKNGNDWDWNEYIERLYCDASNLQVLCKPDHHAKTKAEKMIRSAYRKSKAKNSSPS